MGKQRGRGTRRFGLLVVGLAAPLLMVHSSPGLTAPRRRRQPPRTQRVANEHSPEPRIRLDFRNVEIDRVLTIFSMLAGKTLVKDPSLTGRVTLLNPRPLTVHEGLDVLQTVLRTRGYRLEQDPLLFRVVPERQIRLGK